MFELKFEKVSFRNKMKLAEEIVAMLDDLDDWAILQRVVREVYIAQMYLNNFDKFVQVKDDGDDEYMDILATYDVIYELGFMEFMEETIGREYEIINDVIDQRLKKKEKEESIEGAIIGLIREWEEKTKDLDIKQVMEEFNNLDKDKYKYVKAISEWNRGKDERRE